MSGRAEFGLDGSAFFETWGGREYRPFLERRIGFGPSHLWICQNPSWAGAHENDHSVKRMLHHSQRAGAGRLGLINVGDIIATDAAEFWRAADGGYHRSPVWAELSPPDMGWDLVICAWGGDRRLLPMARDILDRMPGAALRCIGLTQSGAPRHPARTPNGLDLLDFTLPEVAA